MRPSRRTGFTLSELLVGLVVTSIVLAATAAIFIGVQNSYQAETEAKVITENGRGSLQFLERVLPLAGYGIDPRLAFDRTIGTDNQDVQGVTFSPGQTAMTGPAQSIVTDDLAFRYRDPTFLRLGRFASAAHTGITLEQPAGVAIPLGKLLMVGCRGGVEFLMARVSGTAVAAGDTTISVTPAVAAPFQNNSNSCLTSTGAQSPYVFIVQEHRIRIVNLGGRPWLVSFRNLESTVTDLTAPMDPIAPDVEVFQVAFALNRARAALGCCTTAPDVTGGNSNWVMGDSGTEALPTQPGNVLTTSPTYRTPYDDPTRFTVHPANIRAVELALVVRSSRRNATGRRSTTVGSLFNCPAPTSCANPTTSNFDRSVFHTSIFTPNLMSRTGFVPALRTATSTTDINHWGG